jgi:hypothetical protein
MLPHFQLPCVRSRKRILLAPGTSCWTNFYCIDVNTTAKEHSILTSIFLFCLLECWYQCICNLGAAQPAPVIPGLPAVIDDGTNRTGTVTNMTTIVLPAVVLPRQGECAKVENKTTTNPYQAVLTATNTTFTACEGSSDCPRAGDCCAATQCICGPYDNDKQRLQWCV